MMPSPGAVIRGSTSHYDLVCNEAAKGRTGQSADRRTVTPAITTGEHRAGHRARRHQGRQQGRRCSDRGSSWQTCCRSFKGYENAPRLYRERFFVLYGFRIENRKNHEKISGGFHLSHCSVSAHERGQLLNPLQRNGERHRLHGDGHQLHRVIVNRCAGWNAVHRSVAL